MHLNKVKAIYDKASVNIILMVKSTIFFLKDQKQDKDTHAHDLYST